MKSKEYVAIKEEKQEVDELLSLEREVKRKFGVVLNLRSKS